MTVPRNADELDKSVQVFVRVQANPEYITQFGYRWWERGPNVGNDTPKLIEYTVEDCGECQGHDLTDI